MIFRIPASCGATIGSQVTNARKSPLKINAVFFAGNFIWSNLLSRRNAHVLENQVHLSNAGVVVGTRIARDFEVEAKMRKHSRKR